MDGWCPVYEEFQILNLDSQCPVSSPRAHCREKSSCVCGLITFSYVGGRHVENRRLDLISTINSVPIPNIMLYEPPRRALRIMRAVIFKQVGVAPELLDVDLAAPGPGEVKVKIAGAGVCGSDLHIQRGEWELPLPLVMGHEGSGTVVEVGDGVTDLAIGDHVVLSWVAPCNKCRFCLAGREAQCAVFASVVAPGGVLHDGTSRLSRNGEVLHHYLGVSSFAEYSVLPASGAIKVRKDAALDLIALVGCAVATGVGAVKNTAKVPKGATVAVIGCGGVGLSVVQGARIAGASRIVAIDINSAKIDLAMTLGATDKIAISREDNPSDALRDLISEGVDFAFDAIGHTSTTEAIIRMLALGGAAVIVGLPRVGAKASFEPLSLAEADQRILGSNYGSIRPAIDIPWLVDQYMEGNLKLEEMVSARRPLSEAALALGDLELGNALRQILIP